MLVVDWDFWQPLTPRKEQATHELALSCTDGRRIGVFRETLQPAAGAPMPAGQVGALGRTQVSCDNWTEEYAARRAAAGLGDAQSLSWEALDIRGTINPDGSIDVVETHRVVFTSGRFDHLAVKIGSPAADLTRLAASEGDLIYAIDPTTPLPSRYARSWEVDEQYWVGWWFPEVVSPAVRTYTISYRLNAAVRAISDTRSEIDWQVEPPDPLAPIWLATVNMRLPDTIDPAGVRLSADGASVQSGLLSEKTASFTASMLTSDGGLHAVAEFGGPGPAVPQAVPTPTPTAPPPTSTPTSTATPAASPTAPPTETPAPTPTDTPPAETPEASVSATGVSPTVRPTVVPSPTATPPPQVAPTPEAVPTPQPEASPAVVATPEGPAPTATIPPLPSETPTVAVPSATPTLPPPPTETPTIVPTRTPTPRPTARATATATATPRPTLVPTVPPTLPPTVLPTVEPTVPSPSLQAITIAPANSTVTLGGSVQLSATGRYSDGSAHDLTNVVQWRSANPTVATVSRSGLVTAASTGSTTVTATSDSVTGSTRVTVTEPTVTTIGMAQLGRNPVAAH